MVSIMIKRFAPQLNRKRHGAKEEKTNRWGERANARTRSLAGTQAPNGALTAALFLICWSFFSFTRFVAEYRLRFLVHFHPSDIYFFYRFLHRERYKKTAFICSSHLGCLPVHFCVFSVN